MKIRQSRIIIMITLREDVADGFVLCAGAGALLKQAHICEEHKFYNVLTQQK